MPLRPFQLMTRVVDKLYSDQATAIVVAPEWQRTKWYGRLVNIAARTYRIPRRRVQLYCDINGRTFRQRSWHTVAFLVDPTLPRQGTPVKPSISVWPVIRWIEEVLLTPNQKKRLCWSYQELLTGDLDARGDSMALDGESSVLTDPPPAITKHARTNATEKKGRVLSPWEQRNPQCPSLWVIKTPPEQIRCDTTDQTCSVYTLCTTSGPTTSPESAIALRRPRRTCRSTDGACVRRRLVFDNMIVAHA